MLSKIISLPKKNGRILISFNSMKIKDNKRNWISYMQRRAKEVESGFSLDEIINIDEINKIINKSDENQFNAIIFYKNKKRLLEFNNKKEVESFISVFKK